MTDQNPDGPEFRAVPGNPAQEMPATVRRVFRDSEGRRVTQFVAVCNSTGIDNDAMAARIAAALNADGQPTKTKHPA